MKKGQTNEEYLSGVSLSYSRPALESSNLCPNYVFEGYNKKVRHNPLDPNHQRKTYGLLKSVWYCRLFICDYYYKYIDYYTAVMPYNFYHQKHYGKGEEKNKYLQELITKVENEHSWLYLSLLPQLTHCGEDEHNRNQIIDYPIVDCTCQQDSGKLEHLTSYTKDCLSDKMIFTGNLMALRIICDNKNSLTTEYEQHYVGKKGLYINQQLLQKIQQNVIQTINWCREKAISFKPEDSDMFYSTDNIQANFLNVCLNWVQKCTDYYIDYYKNSQYINSDCNIDQETYDKLSKKVSKIDLIKRNYFYTKIGSEGASRIVFILSIILPTSHPGIVIAGGIISLLKVLADRYLFYLQSKNEGKWIKMSKYDVYETTVAVGELVNSLSFSFGCITYRFYDVIKKVLKLAEMPTKFSSSFTFKKQFNSLFLNVGTNKFDEDFFFAYLNETINNTVQELVKINTTTVYNWVLVDYCRKDTFANSIPYVSYNYNYINV